MRGFAFVLAAALIALSAPAQEFDVFDINDFVDPNLHGTRFASDGRDVDHPGETFHVLRGTTGGVANYAWRSTPTNSSILFLHFADSMYRGAWQTNVKFTTLQGETQRFLPRYRMALELGRYAYLWTTVGDKSGQIPARWLLSGALEENRTCPEIANTRCRRRFNAELGGRLETSVTIKGVTSTATANLVWRNAGDDGKQLYRGTLFYQWIDYTISGRYRFRTAMGTGFERTDAFHWGVTRIGSTLSMDLRDIGTLNVAWTPTYRPSTEGRRVFNEVAVFFDKTLFARLGERRCFFTGC